MAIGRSVPAGPIEAVTILVADLDAATDLYRAGIGFCVRTRGNPPPVLVQTLPVLAGCRMAVLASPNDVRPGVLRLVEVPSVYVPRTLATFGWAAAELIVADADEAAERAKEAGLQVLADPAPVGTGGGLRAAQVRGPAGEALYLTQIDQAPSGFRLPKPIDAVGRVFIAVLASRDLETSRSALERLLGARRVTDHALPVRAINASMGLPPDTPHRLSSVQIEGAAAVEVDQYPTTTEPRENQTELTGGIICVSVHDRSVPGITAIPASDGALLDLSNTHP
jgi:catechol 2,3-dioxygenase-like lactoylglutathione lyase family enzyme